MGNCLVVAEDGGEVLIEGGGVVAILRSGASVSGIGTEDGF